MLHTILDTIGNTPIVRLPEFEKLFKNKQKLYAKLEYFNPFGSIKDRSALQIINDAESTSSIKGNTVIEATSGNLGIALSAICQIKGYRSIIVMPENVSRSRKELVKKYGAEIILTDARLGMLGSIEKAREILTDTEAFHCDQFHNYSSVRAHFLNTAKEIDIQLSGEVDVIVCGIGSGGTISGIAKYFKMINQSTEIIGVLPISYPHEIQGIGAGFTPAILDTDSIDKVHRVSYEDAMECRERLLRYTSIFAGISSGAVLSCVLKYLNEEKYANKSIVMIFPDNGERYI